MGVDVGSVSTNIILLDSEDNKKIYESLYIRNNGQPIDSIKQGFKTLTDKGYASQDIIGVGVTGSARVLIGNIIGADSIKNEITAHSVAAIESYPDVRTIIEIGGQDSKMIIIRDGIVVDFSMNTICAAGTGSFLDQQAFRLKLPIEEFGEYALKADKPVRIAGRCTVFAETDMIHKQQEGATKEQIVAGLCEALTRNYLNNVGKGKKIETPILFQGGVAFNKGIKNSFEKELGLELIIPENHNVMGAIGSGILAKETLLESQKTTKFKGLEIMQKNYKLKRFYCEECANGCELTEVSDEKDIIAKWGDRCGKWQK